MFRTLLGSALASALTTGPAAAAIAAADYPAGEAIRLGVEAGDVRYADITLA